MINLPKRLEESLGSDLLTRSRDIAGMAPFLNWYHSSGTIFFREYTDHGPRHVGQVLAAAASLISDSAWPEFTRNDAVVLLYACLLHDCGMHLTEDGFLALVNPASPRPLLEDTGDRPWPQLWTEFTEEIRRYDERRLHRLLGHRGPVRPPPLDSSAWQDVDRRVIGEFIRRHHPRIAHECAVFGVPLPAGAPSSVTPIQLPDLDPEVVDLVGFIARSHGLPLRAAMEYMARRGYHPRDHQDVHAIYLMGLLRLADYLQIQSDRAPKDYLRVQALRSPLSSEEWLKHRIVKGISHQNEDPEAIHVTARPEDLPTYLGFRRLLDDIQSELDQTWAVLGEVYGRYLPLTLTLRRVRSNLDDLTAFSRTVSYVPRAASLGATTASAKFLRVLIEPLYGDRPDIGIRELLQNAVDAVRTRADLAGAPARIAGDELPDVRVSLERREDGSGRLVVTDRGVGMKVETIVDYFLKAGASFRDSEEFQRLHTRDGHSRVLRSGRFGIGVLAAFLLGERIRVVTRHATMGEEGALEFDVGLSADLICLRRIKAEIGTRVEIELSRDTCRRLAKDPEAWFWYRMMWPAVRYEVGPPRQPFPFPEESGLERSKLVPERELGDFADAGWMRIENGGYPVVDLCYETDAPALSCNGIQVLEHWPSWRNENPSVEEQRLLEYQLSFLPFRIPSLSIQDPDALLPLDIRRLSLARIDEALRQLAQRARPLLAAREGRDWVRKLAGHVQRTEPDHSPGWGLGPSYALGDYRYQVFLRGWCESERGMLWLLPTALRRAGVRRIFFLNAQAWEALERPEPASDEAIVPFGLDSGRPVSVLREFLFDPNHIRDFIEVSAASMLAEAPGREDRESDAADSFRADPWAGHLIGLPEQLVTPRWRVLGTTTTPTAIRLAEWADLLARTEPDRRARAGSTGKLAGAWELAPTPVMPTGWRDADIADTLEQALSALDQD